VTRKSLEGAIRCDPDRHIGAVLDILEDIAYSDPIEYNEEGNFCFHCHSNVQYRGLNRIINHGADCTYIQAKNLLEGGG